MLNKLLRQKTDHALIQLLRSVFVSGLAFVVDFGALYMLTEQAGMYYLYSAAIAFLIGLTTNYLLSVSWVFRTRTVRNRLMEFSIFGFLGILGLVGSLVLMYILTDWADCHYLLSKGMTTAVVFVWNFGSRKLMLFHIACSPSCDSPPATRLHEAEDAWTAVASDAPALLAIKTV
jgi:putative flippase GtrA